MLTKDGRCDKHRKVYVQDANRRKVGERRMYDKRRWRDRIRPQQLREHPLCEDCQARGQAVAATEVDHRDGDSSNNAPENLSSKCKSCHSRKTAKQDGAFGNRPGGG